MHGSGNTRVLSVFEFPSERETFPTSEHFRHLTFLDPLAHLGTTAVESDTYTLEGGWDSERTRTEAEAEEAAWKLRMEKLYGK